MSEITPNPNHLNGVNSYNNKGQKKPQEQGAPAQPEASTAASSQQSLPADDVYRQMAALASTNQISVTGQAVLAEFDRVLGMAEAVIEEDFSGLSAEAKKCLALKALNRMMTD